MDNVILGASGPTGEPMIGLSPSRSRRAIFILFGLLLLTAAAMTAAFRQQSWEYEAIRALNSYAHRSAAFDRAIHALTVRDLLEGVLFVATIWYLWFDTTALEVRARLLTGTAAAALAGIVSRLLQIGLPTHLRPLHTPDLGFVLPFGVEPDALNHYNSFPSDHGAVYFTLALVICRRRLTWGLAAMCWAAIVDAARVYDGYHYPTDIVGSIGLAVAIMGLLETEWILRLARRMLRFEETHRGLFYMLAFVTTYQLATLFDDLRQIGVGFASVILHRNPFLGG